MHVAGHPPPCSATRDRRRLRGRRRRRGPRDLGRQQRHLDRTRSRWCSAFIRGQGVSCPTAYRPPRGWRARAAELVDDGPRRRSRPRVRPRRATGHARQDALQVLHQHAADHDRSNSGRSPGSRSTHRASAVASGGRRRSHRARRRGLLDVGPPRGAGGMMRAAPAAQREAIRHRVLEGTFLRGPAPRWSRGIHRRGGCGRPPGPGDPGARALRCAGRPPRGVQLRERERSPGGSTGSAPGDPALPPRAQQHLGDPHRPVPVGTPTGARRESAGVAGRVQVAPGAGAARRPWAPRRSIRTEGRQRLEPGPRPRQGPRWSRLEHGEEDLGGPLGDLHPRPDDEPLRRRHPLPHAHRGIPGRVGRPTRRSR